jgi:hypothetical protein
MFLSRVRKIAISGTLGKKKRGKNTWRKGIELVKIP